MPTTAPAGPLAEWARELRDARLRVDEIEPQFEARVRSRRVRDVTRRGQRSRASPPPRPCLTLPRIAQPSLHREGYAA